MLIQQRALEEGVMPPLYHILSSHPTVCLLTYHSSCSSDWVPCDTNSSTQSETDSILLNSECFCKHSLFPPSGPFFSFFPLCSHAEVFPWMSLPPHRLCCHHCSYFWALNRFSLSDHITQLPAESRQQLFAPLSPPLSHLHPPPSSSSPVLSLTASPLVLKDVDVHSFDLALIVLHFYSFFLVETDV